MFTELDGRPEGRETISYNSGVEEFNQVICSSDIPQLNDPGDIHLCVLATHDEVYGLGTYHPKSNEPAPVNADKLEPMLMKHAYDIHGRGSIMDHTVEEYIGLDVFKYTGLTLSDWLNMRRVEHNIIKRGIESRRSVEASVANELERDLKKKVT